MTSLMPLNDSLNGLTAPQTKRYLIFSPVTLPCGRVVQNRLVKVAMYEHLASFRGGPPNPYHYSLYSKWAKHNWGIVITGNVQVCASHLTLGRDMVVPNAISEKTVQPYRILAAAMHNEYMPQNSHSSIQNRVRTLAIMQLSHAGRQSTNVIGGRLPFSPPLAPSAIAIGHGSIDTGISSRILHHLLFQTPRAMSSEEIDDVVNGFVRGAEVAVHAGFDGVQLHVAHGYLLAQFVSPKSNDRTDCYASTPNTSLNLLHRIVLCIRQVVPSDFVLSVKINSTDYLDRTMKDHAAESNERRDLSSDGKPIAQALAHVRTIALWGNIDFMEISGGDYENPRFMLTHPSPRQAFFTDFSQQAMEILEPLPRPTPLILLTGGLRTPYHLHVALVSRHTHLLGLGRGSVLCPDLPELLKGMDENDKTPFAPEPRLFTGQRLLWTWVWAWVPKVNLIGAGIGMAWYIIRMRHIAIIQGNKKKDTRMSGIEAVFRMWFWIGYGGIGNFGQRVSIFMWCFVAILIAIFWPVLSQKPAYSHVGIR